MTKVLTLLFILLLSLACLIAYLFITEKIVAGSQKIAEGQLQLEQGEAMLAAGKAKLADGTRKLAQARGVYNQFKAIPFVGLATKLPISKEIIGIAHQKIADGGALVAKGNAKVKAGQAQLAEGKLELAHGEERLDFANQIRIVCAIGAIIFASLALVLGFYWRRSLSGVWKKQKLK